MSVLRNICFAIALTGLVFGQVAAGTDWIQVPEIPAGEVHDLEVAGNTLYAGHVERVYSRLKVSDAWTPGNPLGANVEIWSLHHVNNRLLAGTFGSGVYESTDGGNVWTRRISGLTTLPSRYGSCFASRGDSVYVGTSGAGIYASSLTGTLAWLPFRNGLGSSTDWEIFSLHNWHENLFTGAGLNAYLFRNRPGLTNWEGIPFAPFIETGLAMLGFGHRGDTLYGAASNGIYTSFDSGITWTYFAAPFSVASEGHVVVTPNQVFVILFHLTQGTFIWERKGGTWELFDHQQFVSTYDVVYFDDRLYAGRLDGVWYLPLNPTDVNEPDQTVPQDFSLAQNYPNPFNPSTTIEYRLVNGSDVTIDIFNLLGRKVRTLVSESRPAGVYRIEWDGTDDAGAPVATGMYLYRLRAGENVITKKMLLVK